MGDNYLILSRFCDDSSHWVLEPRLGNNPNTTRVQMPAEHPHEEVELVWLVWDGTEWHSDKDHSETACAK